MFRGLFELCCGNDGKRRVKMPKKPTKKQLSDAGKALRNPRTREKKESAAAKILRRGRKK
jgi:hypothetical protein